MPAQTKPKPAGGTRQDGRRCGKAWKRHLHPDVRLAQEKKKAADKRERKIISPVDPVDPPE